MNSQEPDSIEKPTQFGEKAGSLETSGPAFLVIGKLRRPHGIHGEIVMEVFTVFPDRIRKDRGERNGRDQCKRNTRRK